MIDIKRVLSKWFANVLKKRLLVVVLKMRIFQIKKLADELHKPIIRKFEKGKVHSSFIDSIQGADLADMQLIRKFNDCFLLCVIDIFSKSHGLFV